LAKKQKKKKQPRRLAKKLLSLLLIIALAFGYAVFSGEIQSTDDLLIYLGLKQKTIATMEESALVHFIDVGQGDCTLIQIGDKNILIDAGENYMGDTVVSYLHSVGVKRLNMIVMSHPHSDHIGGVDTVMNAFKVGQLVMPNISDTLLPTSKTFLDIINLAQKKNIPVKTAEIFDCFTFNGGVFTVFGPVRQYDDLNNNSLVLQLTYGNYEFLFTGDCEKKAEYELLYSGFSSDIDVLKVAHHGSKDSTTQKFLTTTAPEYSVISCGAENDYGHPNAEALERLKDCGTKILVTAECGTVVFETDGEKLIYHTEKGES